MNKFQRYATKKNLPPVKTSLRKRVKQLGVLEENLLELDINKEDLDKDLEQINVKLDESSTEFKQETSGLLKKQEKAEKQIAILAPRRTSLLKKIPKIFSVFMSAVRIAGLLLLSAP